MIDTETTRRAMLRSMALGGGATLLSSFLAQLAAHAVGDESRVKRRRVIFVMQSNGMSPQHLFPSGIEQPKYHSQTPSNGAQWTDETLRDRTFPAAIEPLTEFRDRMTILLGLSGRVAVSDHSANLGALGCYPGGSPLAQTIDSALGDALPNTFSHVAVGYASGDPMCYSYSASGPGKRLPIICSPALAFKSLFGSVAQGAEREAFDQRTNLLDFMTDDVRRARANLAGEERQKLDQYLEAFESLHRRQKELLAKADVIKRHAPRIDDKITLTTLNLEAQFEIATAALLAGLTNVVTLTSGGGGQRFGNYPEFGIPDLHHIGHGGSYGEKNFEQCFVEIRRFHTKLIASLVKKLAGTPEGDGTMLDNSLIVYLSDSAEAHHPSCREWPVVLIGNLGGKLKTDGRFLRYPAYGEKGHRTMANLYLTFLHAVGKPRDQFGVPDVGLKDCDQTGPLTELLS